MHTYMHKYIHTYIHTYIHVYMVQRSNPPPPAAMVMGQP